MSETGGTPEPLTQLDTAKGEAMHRMPQLLPDRKNITVSRHPDSMAKSHCHAAFSGGVIQIVSTSTERLPPIRADGSPCRGGLRTGYGCAL